MRAVRLEAARGAVSVVDVAEPAPGPGEVLLRMEACGVCHSDVFVAGLEKLKLEPVTLGHEGIGRVVQVGPCVEAWRVGDRVGATFLASTCGACALCATGRERYCAKQVNAGYSADGVMAEMAVVPAQHLAHIPETLSAVEAAPLCCAGWTAYGAVREAGLSAGQSLAIFGMGGLGHLALQYARRKGIAVIAADVSDEKLEIARAMGATASVDAAQAGRTVQKEHGGVDAAVVFTASTEAIAQAFRSVRRTGRVVLVGLAAANYELPLVDTVLKGIEVRGSFLGTREDLAEVMRLAASGAVKAHTQAFSLDEAPAVLQRLKEGKVRGRAVIAF